MNQYNLYFQGYTWDDYFFVISEKQGVLVTYRGSLDSEGVLKMDEILYVAGARRLCDIYGSEIMYKLRKDTYNRGLLFFSYAETDNNYQEIAEILSTELSPRFNTEAKQTNNCKICCQGACTLFPNKILSRV